ncbi:MAG: PASTA domain-containing protein [Actinomycetota bacterium]
MAERLRAHLPLLAIVVLLGLAGTATLTYAAGRQLGTAPGTATVAAPTPPIAVPDVEGQAFVFAKGALEDAGFAWRVIGSVHGYAANTVASQSPAAGTRVIDTGAPLITLTLKRNGSYGQTGESQDASPYAATALEPAALASALGPAHPATDATATTPAPVATTKTTVTTAPAATTTAAPAARPKVATPTKHSTWPQTRPVAFAQPGARAEPLDEMPLPDRAQLLRRWLDAHPKRTGTNVSHWLYQNAWIVTGAKLGWWHGSVALTTLVALDRQAQTLWGIGSKSALKAQVALDLVKSKSAAK